MPQIIITAKAARDLQRIKEYLAPFSSETVQKSALTIINAIDRLLDNPMMGRPVEDMPFYRSVVVKFGAGAYTICYRVDAENNIIVVTIKHGREKSIHLV